MCAAHIRRRKEMGLEMGLEEKDCSFWRQPHTPHSEAEGDGDGIGIGREGPPQKRDTKKMCATHILRRREMEMGLGLEEQDCNWKRRTARQKDVRHPHSEEEGDGDGDGIGREGLPKQKKRDAKKMFATHIRRRREMIGTGRMWNTHHRGSGSTLTDSGSPSA
jgi:hypothetical protein